MLSSFSKGIYILIYTLLNCCRHQGMHEMMNNLFLTMSSRNIEYIQRRGEDTVSTVDEGGVQ